jgi:hypothetical protein
MPGQFTVVVAALPAAIWACFEIANRIRCASGASEAGAPVTLGVGHGLDGVGSGVIVGVKAVGIGADELGGVGLEDGAGEPLALSGGVSEHPAATASPSAASSNGPVRRVSGARDPRRVT